MNNPISEEITSDIVISYLHCKTCIDELPNGKSPRDYVRNEVAINDDNQMLIGCTRHNKTVAVFTLRDDIRMKLIGKGTCDCCE
tara:strand:+ start:980 stop:1231 length:252 start_codon:yes stop_codon:yes gene_type:complete